MSFHAPAAVLAAWILTAGTAVSQEESSAASQPFGRIAAADVTLRCFPTEISPAYEEALNEGDVVRVAGQVDNGFTPVSLPMGVRGYVHKNFSTVDEAGVLTSAVPRLAFRYRPNSGEAPVQFVTAEQRFLVIEEQEDWWVVRYPERTAWVPSDAVVTFAPDAPVATLEAAWSDLEARQAQAVTDFAAARKAAAAAAEAERARIEELAAVGAAFVEETRKPNAEQDFAAVTERATAVRDAAGEGDASRGQAGELLEDIAYQEKLVAASLLLAEEPVAAEPVVPASAVRDPMRDYVSGWLRSTGGLFGSARGWELTKGGQVLFTVQCTSGRYDLEMYDGFEVALHGRAARPDPESLRLLDVDRLRVLGKSPR